MPLRRTVQEGRSVGTAVAEARTKNRLAFIGETWAEFKKVIWPTRHDTIRLTIIVVALTVSLGLILGGVDFSFSKLVEFLAGSR